MENLEDSTIRVQATDTVVQSYNGEIVDQIKIMTTVSLVSWTLIISSLSTTVPSTCLSPFSNILETWCGYEYDLA